MISLISLVPQVFGQISIGIPAGQDSVEIFIETDGQVHVIHEIRKGTTIQQLNTISGTVSNLKVSDIEGNDVQYGTVSDNTVTIFPTQENVFVEYDLDDALSEVNGVWTWDYLYIQSSVFIFPDNVDLVFANSRPVNILDGGSMRCHGCSLLLEYIIDEPVHMTEFEWEGEEETVTFNVSIRTLEKIDFLNFEQPSKSLSFDVSSNNRFVTLIIPLELLWNPYEVFLDDKKILKHEYFTNGTHAWLNIRPQTSGTITILGTTVIPEFPFLMPLVLGITIVIGLQIRNKINLH